MGGTETSCFAAGFGFGGWFRRASAGSSELSPNGSIREGKMSPMASTHAR
jgi:hypothetical protein